MHHQCSYEYYVLKNFPFKYKALWNLNMNSIKGSNKKSKTYIFNITYDEHIRVDEKNEYDSIDLRGRACLREFLRVTGIDLYCHKLG